MSHPALVTARATVSSHPDEGAWERALHAAVARGSLHAEEAALAQSLPAPRRATFVAGREALREALRQLPAHADAAAAPILRTPRGAPHLPPALTGSITHKQTLAMATVVPRASGVHHVGLDLERRPTVSELTRPSVARKILTGREYAALETFAADALVTRERTLVYFAIKEAVYKAIDPFVERYVRFTEVELDLRDGGVADVRLLLPELEHGTVEVQARWDLEDAWIIASAISRKR